MPMPGQQMHHRQSCNKTTLKLAQDPKMNCNHNAADVAGKSQGSGKNRFVIMFRGVP